MADKTAIDLQLVTSNLNAVLTEVQSVKAELAAIAANPVALVQSLTSITAIIGVLAPLLTVGLRLQLNLKPFINSSAFSCFSLSLLP